MRKGRFHKPAAEIAQHYGESVSFDWRLYCYDITGSIAHAAALTRARIITANERRKIESGLRAIQTKSHPGDSNGTAHSKTCTSTLKQL
jgi:argininosuccinate lyase